jgi:hypothetical protein
VSHPCLIRPIRVEDAYEDRALVWGLVRAAGPYPLMASLAGYEGFQGLTSPWFRAYWALDGQELVEGGGALLANERFIAASRSIFSADIVRPVSVIVNVMCPMRSGEVSHVDTPTYRGLDRRSFPTWLLVTMAASGLFDRWYVPTSGAITWFFAGPGGDYEYRPDGLDGEVQRESSPFGNVAVVADNDRMYHRVSDVGRAEEWLPDGLLPKGAQLVAGDDGGWVVVDAGGTAVHRYPEGKVRVSLLWKAMIFEDDRDAATFDEHHDDLTTEGVVATFCGDLRVRGIAVEEPPDPFLDAAWQRVLLASYPLVPPGA